MMTMIIDRLTALEADVEFSVFDNAIHATLQDFAGFDASWCEIEREYDDEEAVEAFLEWCEDTADTAYTADMVAVFHFGAVILRLGYASADI